MLKKLNFCFEGVCLGPNDTIDTCEYYITAEETSKGGVQVTIDCHSWIGIHCVFNETYPDFTFDTLERLIKDLHEQNLEDVENVIADMFCL